MMRNLMDLPKKVLKSLAVIVSALVIIGIALPLLGGARDTAFADNTRLQSEIGSTTKAIVQAKADQEYLAENQARYEELLKSDRLIPHTRRVAVLDLESKGRAVGITSLNYSIGSVSNSSLQSVAGQPASGDYHVSFEDITLTVGAPFDGPIYRFMDDVSAAFPGAAVVQAVSIARGASAADGVKGDILISWRTAQAQEKNP